MKETAPVSTRPRLQADALKALAHHDWTAATEHLALALIENPAWADGWLNLGLARLHLHQPQAAISALQRGIDLDPNRPRARCTLAEAWLKAGDLDAAAEAGRDECRRFPGLADNWLCLGRTLEQMEHSEAGNAYDRAHQLAPENPDTAWHWARWLNEHHEVDAAYRLLETARARHPDSAQLEWQFAVNCFYREDWIRGLNHMDCRWRLPDFPQGPSPEGVALWQPGTEPVSPILLEPEQGLGDTIQFIRFIPELARRGHRVWLGCPKPLRTLLEGFPGVERLLANTAEAAGAGCRLPLMSLPSRLGITDLSKFSTPYLKVPLSPNDRIPKVENSPNKRRLIGFVWRGNPQHKNDHRRSQPILEFALHLPLQGADWVSLQVGGDVAGELNRLRTHLKTFTATNPSAPEGEEGNLPTIEDAGSQFEDFLNTAQTITATDQVITVDTAVAHLAGALGHPANILLADPPDWRWGLTNTSAEWYQNTTIIRSKKIPTQRTKPVRYPPAIT
jgi:cytochrome c-type biogenesis protein CcmH/NrfG